jgi:hypothetical protein
MPSTSTQSWAELFPNGRDIFYEGDSPDEFAAHIATTYGFDPRTDHQWWDVIDGGDGMAPFVSYSFRCPANLLDAIYGNPAYPARILTRPSPTQGGSP